MPEPDDNTRVASFVADVQRLRSQIDAVDAVLGTELADVGQDTAATKEALLATRYSLVDRLTAYRQLGERFTAAATHFDIETGDANQEWLGAIIRAVSAEIGAMPLDLSGILIAHAPDWGARRCLCGAPFGPAGPLWAEHAASQITAAIEKENRNA